MFFLFSTIWEEEHLPTTYYLLPTTYYVLPTTYYLLPTSSYYQLTTTFADVVHKGVRGEDRASDLCSHKVVRVIRVMRVIRVIRVISAIRAIRATAQVWARGR